MRGLRTKTRHALCARPAVFPPLLVGGRRCLETSTPLSLRVTTTRPTLRWHDRSWRPGYPSWSTSPLPWTPVPSASSEAILEEGKLMSCSGMRYAKELDDVRASLAAIGPPLLVRGAIVLSWEKYGIHLIDAVFGVTGARPVSVVALDTAHSSMGIAMDDGSLLQIDALGEAPPTFRLDFWAATRSWTLRDHRQLLHVPTNAVAFRRDDAEPDGRRCPFRTLWTPCGYSSRATLRRRRERRCCSVTSHYRDLFSLRGKMAIVTGGLGILGRGFCRGLAEFGADIAVVDLDGEACARFAQELTDSVESGLQASGATSPILIRSRRWFAVRWNF